MKKLYILIVLILMLAFATPASAEKHVLTGEPITLWGEPEQTYPANTPFYIADFWWLPTQIYAMGLFEIQLEVDGVVVQNDYIVKDAWTGEVPISIITAYVHNFPEGMQGTHTFTGHWLGTCELALDYGFVTECDKLNDRIEVMSLEIKVHFTP